MSWNPQQYLKFSEPRLRPALDLLARVNADNPRRVCDLGCGAGNVTQYLAKRWPESDITGIDDSPQMLEQAARNYPTIAWRQESIVEFSPTTRFDVLYSNAALHWLPNHSELLPRLLRAVNTGGWFAVQMPRNFLAPSHTSIADVVLAGPWRSKLEHLLAPPPVAEPDFYYELLKPLSTQIDIWETEYLQVLTGKDPVKEWVKGTWLKQFLDRLDGVEAVQFEEAYAEHLRIAYPPLKDGSTLFPFRRLFVIGTVRG